MAPIRDHYQVLGVARRASPEEIRRAHRRLVHVLHPDRHAGASSAERGLAERRMREINQAWHVLSDPARRGDYDRSLGASSAGSSASSANGHGRANGSRPTAAEPHRAAAGTAAPRSHAAATGFATTPRSRPTAEPDEDDLEVHPGTFFLLRRGPLVVTLVLGALIFVVTAYAGTGGDDEAVRPPAGLDACVLLQQGGAGQLVDCSLPNDGKVVAEVDAPLDCPERTRYVQIGSEFVCIPRPDA